VKTFVVQYLSLFTADLAKPLSPFMTAWCLDSAFGAHLLQHKQA